jgi:hypothetical protein
VREVAPTETEEGMKMKKQFGSGMPPKPLKGKRAKN